MTYHRFFRNFASAFVLLLGFAVIAPFNAMSAPKPLRILLLAGGCCHDYGAQKDILKLGIESRVNATVDVIYSPDTSTHPPLPIYGNPNYAKGYDLVIHDECAADINDPAVIEGVLKPHRDGIPGVNLHCAMHCYRVGDPNDAATPGTPHALWFEYLGIRSSGHGQQLPISITFTDPTNPITRGMSDWTTIHEELYNNKQLFDKMHPLARGKQTVKKKDGTEKVDDYVVAWTNEYGPKKTRVFSTTIGHNNGTVSDPRYLDLVARGVLWATGHLKKDGTPAKGYGPQGPR